MTDQVLHETIRKPPAVGAPPNMPDYARACAEFSWEHARRDLAGLPGGGLNIAHEAVDRHAGGPLAATVALRFRSRRDELIDLTYAELSRETARFANVLSALGVQRGERVFALAGRIPELYVTVLGTLKHGAVFCPLFSAFGPGPIEQRLRLGGASVLVTTPSLYRRKVAQLRPSLPGLAHVLLVGDAEEIAGITGVLDFRALMRAADVRYEVAATEPADMALLHFTSGTTGEPKGAVHVHEAVVAHRSTGRMVLDLRPGDVFWCTADPGWVTGTSYGIIAPLTVGATSVVDEADFEADRWYRILQDEHVSVWYTAPTALRMLMRVGAEVAHEYDLRALRFVASVGEPLNPEVVVWGQEAFGLPVHDNWWQTETGGIMVANFRSMDVRPGSMGRPLPGIEAAVARRDANDKPVVGPDGTLELLERPDEQGELVLRPGWPSMFRAYLGDEERYRKSFAGGWYLTGDLVRRDADGYYWFIGRGNDVIKSSGHLIGPFEVESALLEHPAVAEAGVIGKPDAVAGEIVKAFVTLKPGHEGSDELHKELLGFARQRLGAAVAPREIEFVESVPHTRSGKIMRRLLRARELGLPEGDVSTLESS
ncbi:MAG TPA: acetate--CoA ligase [Solirubrobacteraceae bacterium]|nr:acetate--CoA ligase [Solirubrobacteraceae bacterium]